MKYLLKVDYAEVEVCIDSYEEGELDYVNTWYIDNLEGRTFKTASELAEAINHEAGCFSASISDYVYIDGRIDTDATVNSDNEEPSHIEYQQWKNGALTLYTAHLYCGITMEPTDYEHDLTEEEAEAFGIPIN